MVEEIIELAKSITKDGSSNITVSLLAPGNGNLNEKVRSSFTNLWQKYEHTFCWS